ncbi:phage replication protein [Enterococcus gallinarum]|uniref:phage replication protein n=1 Tax=Enterococcus gallinarum TaxID=1353 RepID=UPI00336A1BCB
MAELNVRQDRFLKALLECASVDQACKKAGINRTTGYKYLKDPVFLAKYRGLRRDAMQQVTTQLQQAAVEAVDVLKEVMNNTEAPAASRVSSAKNVLDVAYRAFELDDLAEEVEKIKEQLEE